MKAKKLVCLGFDGMMPEMIDKFIDDLPNTKKLLKGGSYVPTLPSPICDTPTNWTSLVTGAWTGTHGITSFEVHFPGTKIYEKKGVFNNKELCSAEYIWQAAEKAKKRSIIINYPVGWPPTVKKGIVVGGDGLHSDQWTLGGHNYYHTEPTKVRRKGTVVSLRKAKEWTNGPQSKILPLETEIIFEESNAFKWTAAGAINQEETYACLPRGTEGGTGKGRKRGCLRFVYHILIFSEGGKGYDTVLISRDKDGKSPLAILKEGESSPWIFEIFGDRGEGTFQFKLCKLSPDGKKFGLYLSLAGVTRGWSYPDKIAGELKKNVGPFIEGLELMGEADEGWLQKFGEMMEVQCDLLTEQAIYLSRKYPWDLIFIQVHSQDGGNHDMLAFVDPDSPKYTSKKAKYYWEKFRENYIITDKMLGKIMNHFDDGKTAIAVFSDHGGVTTSKHVLTEGPFVRKGLIRYKQQKDGRYFLDIEKSKVMLTNNTYVWINLKGREKGGIVDKKEYEALRSEIISLLYSIRDPETGECPVALAMRKEDLASLGQWGERVGDVCYYLKPGYTDYFHPREYINPKDNEFFKAADILAKGEVTISHRFHGIHHSHLPDASTKVSSNRGVFMLKGPGVKKGYRGRNMNIVNVTPTLSHVLDIPAPAQNEGDVAHHMLDERR